MKKSLLIVGLLLAMSLTASAQNTGFAFGFKLGPCSEAEWRNLPPFNSCRFLDFTAFRSK